MRAPLMPLFLIGALLTQGCSAQDDPALDASEAAQEQPTAGKGDINERCPSCAAYIPTAAWAGRLILPEVDARDSRDAVWFEVAQSPKPELVGQRIKLTWDVEVAARVERVRVDVNFSEQAKMSEAQGNVHPQRLDGWSAVGPLESLAGAHLDDDVLVALDSPALVDGELRIRRAPVMISGSQRALVQLLEPVEASSGAKTVAYKVRHFKRGEGFSGFEEIIELKRPAAPAEGRAPRASLEGIEAHPLNAQGWYVYGDRDAQGVFVANALEPRGLMLLEADAQVVGLEQSERFVERENFSKAALAKGSFKRTSLSPSEGVPLEGSSLKLGERFVVVHLFGGVSDQGEELFNLIVTGHFAFGVAEVVEDVFTGAPRFEVEYSQVYAHNREGIISGRMQWHHYMGDLSRGWMYLRPVSDVLLRMDFVSQGYDFTSSPLMPLDGFLAELEVMTDRYRVGDGSGASIVTPATSCVQDSSRALFVALMKLERFLADDATTTWLEQNSGSAQAERFERLTSLADYLEEFLTPVGITRADWLSSEGSVAIVESCPEAKLGQIACGLSSYNTMFPRHAHDEFIKAALTQGAQAWVLRTNQIGGEIKGYDPLAPTSPTTLD